MTVSVIIPMTWGLPQSTRALTSLLADKSGDVDQIIVIENGPAEPAMTRRLNKLAEENRILHLQNKQPGPIAAAVNQAIAAASGNDVVIIDSRIQATAGWLGRLITQAYATAGIATVSPRTADPGSIAHPSASGSPMLSGRSFDLLDQAWISANAGHFSETPANPNLCLYIRRQALQDVGVLDVENPHWDLDFCLRATAAGWRHRLVFDIFRPRENPDALAPALAVPDNPSAPIAEDPAAPDRFAITAALFAASGRPVILMVSDTMGGGIRQHIDNITRRITGLAHVLLLEGTPDGFILSIPALPDPPRISLTTDQTTKLEAMLRSASVSRVHIHHAPNIGFDLAGMIRRLGVTFDITIHDYFAICPQIDLLPRPVNLYCGLPEPAACNACIAISPSAVRARDILTWRQEQAWLFHEADRVICPSHDVKQRLASLGLADRAIVAPHDPVTTRHWPLAIPKLSLGTPLRVVLLGTLTPRNGSLTVAGVAMAAEPGTLDIHCIGQVEATVPQWIGPLMTITRLHDDDEMLLRLLDLRPHVVWLPSAAPETYGDTLGTAIDAGVPIVATNFGAFPERLAGRPFTWLVDQRASDHVWVQTFDQVRNALHQRARKQPAAPRPQIPDFYTAQYLSPRSRSRRRTPGGDKPTIAVVPERFASGHLSPCAFIRLLQPLDHPRIGGAFNIRLDNPDSILSRNADIIVTQRHALPDQDSANALLAHARKTGAKLVFDLDDDLLSIPPGHSDAASLRPNARIVRTLLDAADTVWLSSPGLMKRLARIRPDAILMENGLDERIWAYGPAPIRFQPAPLRILCMGTGTHHDDLAMIMPGLARLTNEYAGQVAIDIIGMTDRIALPAGIRRLAPPLYATQSYPAFVHWINTHLERWHIGLAPLRDTPFNRCKSSIKTLDYAAMGMAVLASDMPVYHGSLADGPAGQLVENDPDAWYLALDWLLRDHVLRQALANRSRPLFLERYSLASQAPARQAALGRLLATA